MSDPLLINTLIQAMRSKTYLHWTPKYLLYRLKRHLYELTHQSYPWLTPQANIILAGWLRNNHVGFEWGAGRSTLWFAKRCKFLTSVEHDPYWYYKINRSIKCNNLNNVTLILAKKKEEYIGAIQDCRDNSLDFVLVDGIFRDECALLAVRKVKVGGLLIVDNMNWYIPSASKSPGSKALHEEPASPTWSEFLNLVKNWYWIWTSDGVTDTVIYKKTK